MTDKPAPRVKLLAAILYAPEAPLERCLALLRERFSALDFQGQPHPFTHTDYYQPEMGAGLMRALVAFSELVEPGELVEAKLAAMRIEQALSHQGKRRVNIDMGYLDLFKLVLASCKGRGNKLYLREGVWADMTLVYQNGGFQPLPWTFPDFAAGAYDEDLEAIRGLLKAARPDDGAE